MLFEEEIKKLSYLSVLWLLFNLELFVTTNRRDCFQHHAAASLELPGRFPRRARPASPQLGGEAGEATPRFPGFKPGQGHAERDPGLAGCLGVFRVLDKDGEGKGKVPEAVGGTWHRVALSK